MQQVTADLFAVTRETADGPVAVIARIDAFLQQSSANRRLGLGGSGTRELGARRLGPRMPMLNGRPSSIVFLAKANTAAQKARKVATALVAVFLLG